METTTRVPQDPRSSRGAAVDARDAAGKGRPRAPSWVLVLLAPVLMLGSYVLAVPVQMIPAVQRVGEENGPGAAMLMMLMHTIVLATCLVLVALTARWLLRTGLRGVGLVFTRASLPLFLLGWAVTAAVVLVAQAVSWGLRAAEVAVPTLPLETPDVPMGMAVMLLLLQVTQAVVLQGLPEELIWRGWLFRGMAHRPRLAAVVSAAAFGAMHIVSSGGQQNAAEFVLYVVMAGAFGLCAGAMTLWLRSLWPAVGVHAGLHLTIIGLSFVPGAEFGPVVWAVSAVLWIAVGAVLLARWKGDRVELVR